MKKNNRILSFFLFLFILSCNPLTWHLMYSKQGVYQSILMTSLFWILPLLGILLIYLCSKREWSSKFQNLMFAFSIAGIFFFVLVGFNKIIGKWLAFKQKNEITSGVIFTPYSKAHYKTTEFEYTAHINNVGLRNKDIDPNKNDSIYRILCFGDSWTFGWGLENEYSWPSQMQDQLHKKGYRNIEVINCGQGGQYTETYKKYLKRALPLLKPDLVLIGVLQIDDLAQLYEQHYPLPDYLNVKKPSILVSYFNRLKNTLISFFKASFSNYFKLISNGPSVKMNIKKNWEESSLRMIESFTTLQKLRFESFPDSVKWMFKTGNLNPGMVTYYLDFPERTLIFNNPQNPATKFALNRMKSDFGEMKQLCNQFKSNLVFLNLPINTFVGHEVTRNSTDPLNSYFRNNNHIDSMYSAVAQENKIPFLSLTTPFDTLSNKSGYFFKYDGHPTKSGQEIIAHHVGEFVLNQFILKQP